MPSLVTFSRFVLLSRQNHRGGSTHTTIVGVSKISTTQMPFYKQSFQSQLSSNVNELIKKAVVIREVIFLHCAIFVHAYFYLSRLNFS